jgi:hypothetical protein
MPRNIREPVGVVTDERRSSSWLIFVAGLVAAALVVLAGVGWALFDDALGKDPGVAACESIRDRDLIAAASGEQPLSEQEYRRLRARFAESGREPLREHGTRFMDAVWNVSNVRQGQTTGAIGFLEPLTTHAQGLQSACADHGVYITLTVR